jgi:hypothetical protein
VQPAVAEAAKVRTRATMSLLVRPDMTTPPFRARPGPPVGLLILIRFTSKQRGIHRDSPRRPSIGFALRIPAADVQVVNDI